MGDKPVPADEKLYERVKKKCIKISKTQCLS